MRQLKLELLCALQTSITLLFLIISFNQKGGNIMNDNQEKGTIKILTPELTTLKGGLKTNLMANLQLRLCGVNNEKVNSKWMVLEGHPKL